MKQIILALMLCLPFAANAWEGYDYDAGNYVEITEDNYVSEGEEIEIYDYEAGEYRWVEVQSVTDTYHSVEVEVYDQTSGQTRYLEMEE